MLAPLSRTAQHWREDKVTERKLKITSRTKFPYVGTPSETNSPLGTAGSQMFKATVR
jgi:hypothetical protein